MIPYAADWLLGPAGALGAVSARAGLAALAAFAAVALLMGTFADFLRQRSLGDRRGKTHSDRLNAMHAKKSGTPAMGGLLVTAVVLITTAACARFAQLDVALLLLCSALLCALGCVDDISKMRAGSQARKAGLRARHKLAGQVMIGLLAGGTLVAAAIHRGEIALVPAAQAEVRAAPSDHESSNTTDESTLSTGLTSLWLPFGMGWALPLGLVFSAWVALVMVATANAVNLSDGLDGLAAGTALPAIAAFGAISWLAGQPDWAAHLHIPYVPGAGELTVACAALGGGWLGFLWHNCHPASVFMGDSGSLPLGGALALVACLTKTELVLPLIAAGFVMEAASVIIQVASFKLTGRRVFRCAPIHHHFRFAGIDENRVVVRFWIVGVIGAVAGLLSLRI